ncbi:MAG: helix-turn-helix domain-containing protein [Acidimicrobiia bacterium]|nr:helix-turn-helix domain-containing protein [Acidimicrobiia bacterium]MYC58358.1 helix-turn-helix domain-containing protein [Acidimicrobiia bacterium]MYG94117.1 helix-turn-helix domain-containing protein [Acidimicrobiia bacterium]MYI30536.1 helix-turn-helix domain-containing protein [Acidimicrobiia bacterium]
MKSNLLLQELNEARRKAGLSKTELARLARTQPAAVRRLFSGNGHNPQIATVATLADVLGHKIRVVPKSREELAAAAERSKGTVSAAEELRKVEGGPFSTILADPPWRFMNRTGKVAPEHRRLSRYDTMTTAEIRVLPISEVVTKNAHLYLWVPNALISDGLEVLESWGFTYKSNIVWAKRRKDGGPDGRGVGFYFRNVTELILFGVRGSMRTLPPGRRQVNMIETRKREHSRKPDEQYSIIENCSPGPYLELFARYSRPKWVSWGLEANEEVIPRGQLYPAYS